MRSRVVVIGGGIAGLAAAHRVTARLGPGSVTLVESAPRLGGKIRTDRRDGFILEGGPDCFLASKPAGVALCEELGLTGRLIDTNVPLRRSYVKRASRLHQLPEGITGLVPSRLAPLLTTGVLGIRGRARAALEPFVSVASGDADESVAAFVRRRFGAEAWDWLVEPLLSGIYAGDGDALSLRATFPQLRETERAHGSLLRPMVAARFKPADAKSKPRGFVTFAGGMQELVDALSAGVGAQHLRLSVRARDVVAADDGYHVTLGDGSTIAAGAVIVATPAHESAGMVWSLDPQLSHGLAQIPFVSTATVSLAFDVASVPRMLKGFGYVSPRAEGGSVVACTWTSNKFGGRAPAGTILVRVFIGRAGADSVVGESGDALATIARDELRLMFGITVEPRLQHVVRWPSALPQYTLGHTDRVSRLFARLENHRGLFLAGASYRGVGIPDCIASGNAAADSAAALLAS